MNKSQAKKNGWIKWVILAATIFAALIIAGFTILAPMINDYLMSHEKIDKRYKRFVISTYDMAYVWPWEELEESERPYETEINGIKYEKAGGRTISEDFIGDKIGTFTIRGFDAITDKQHSDECTMYQLKNINPNEFIAGIITDKYYIFRNSVYNPPQTLGELFERVDLSQFLELGRFSKNNQGPSAKHFILNDDKYVWEVLSQCKEATFIDQDQTYWHMYDREFISFSISSEPLSIYKQSFAITNDGYLSTNAFQWGYLYYIGEDAAEKIIKYTEANSKKTEYEPYSNTKYIYGKIVDITDDCILVDDSILCKKESDGITYKILINNIQFSRYVNLHKIGDLVQISYDGEIHKDISNPITTASKIDTIHISRSE